MRTGAIFARGSCRALKWMALFGVVFALGAGQALAQPTVSSGNFDPGAMTITLTTDVLVYGSPPNSAFTVMVTPLGGSPAKNVVTAVSPIAQTAPSTTIMLTVTTAIKTGSTVAVTYAPASPATTGANTNQIRNVGGDVLAAITSSPTISENDQVPSFTQVADMNLELNKRISPPIELPEATRGNQPFTYTLSLTSVTGTPSDVTVNTGDITATAAGTGADTDAGFRFLASPPTLLGTPSVAGVYTLTYSVADSATPATQTVPQTFKITVAAAPVATTATAMGQIHLMEFVAARSKTFEKKTIGGDERLHVAEGDEIDLNVTVVWKHSELKSMYDAGDTAARTIELEIKGDDESEQMEHVLPDWVSWIDHEGDAHWPNTGACMNSREPGRLCGVVTVKVPANPTTYVGSDRHTKMMKGTLRVYMPHDNHEAENDAFYIEAVHSEKVDLAATASYKKTTPVVVIEDDDPQGIEIKRKTPAVPTPIYESDGSAVFTVTAKPPRKDLPLGVRLDMMEGLEPVSSAQISLSTAALTLNADKDGVSNSADVTVHLPESDGDRVDNSYDLNASVNLYSLGSGAFDDEKTDSVDVDVIDVHKLPRLRVSQSSDTVMEGGTIELTLEIDRNPTNTIAYDPEKRQYSSEEVSVMLSMGSGSSDSVKGDDYAISPNPIMISKHNGRSPWKQTVMVDVEALLNDDIGMEMLALNAEVDGTMNSDYGENTEYDMYHDVAMVAIEDKTVLLVEARSQAELDAAIKEAGADETLTVDDMVTIMGSALFKSVDGATVIYSAKSSDMMVASAMVGGGDVMITAKAKGDAMITVEASATMPSGVMANPQTEPDRASVEIPIAVALAPLTIKLVGPDAGMNLVEGMEYTITAMANRAVEMDTMVELVQTEGTASPADYEVDSITIMMGESMGTTKLMVKEDDMMENDGNMTEMLTLEGRIGAMKTTNSLMFYLWDAAVPALPVIAQLLLAAFLALGGYRRYLRR